LWLAGWLKINLVFCSLLAKIDLFLFAAKINLVFVTNIKTDLVFVAL